MGQLSIWDGFNNFLNKFGGHLQKIDVQQQADTIFHR